MIRRGRPVQREGEEANFRWWEISSRDWPRLSDNFSDLGDGVQIFVVAGAVVEGLELPLQADYLIFLKRDARRKLSHAFPVF